MRKTNADERRPRPYKREVARNARTMETRTNRPPGSRHLAGLALLAALLVLLVPVAHSLAGVSKTAAGLEFTYEDPGAGTVSLAGSFNNWSANAA
ncbi:MAG: hypothetical protein V2A71_09370, partial [Candidatus Eisenbacteria bacterium]